MKRKGKRKVIKKQDVEVAKSSYSPTKAELEMEVGLPESLEDASFDDVVREVLRPVNVVRTDKPK